MKTYLTYGFYIALGSALVVFALYFLNFHSDPSKINNAQMIQMVCGLAIGISCTVFGIKARREEIPPADGFGYGRALGAGVMITLFAALFGTAFNYLYTIVINPNFTEVVLQAQTAKLEAQGLSSDKIEQINSFTRGIMKPAIQSAFGFIIGMFFGTIISLIAAAFLKRPATDEIVAA